MLRAKVAVNDAHVVAVLHAVDQDAAHVSCIVLSEARLSKVQLQQQRADDPEESERVKRREKRGGGERKRESERET